MTTTADTVPLDVRVRRGVVDELLLLVLAGIPTGALVAGLGSRLAMLILRLTSHPRVNGIQSDDDFTIGRFTLGGTYNLMVIGAAAGIIGAAAYQWVRPWLIGPHWFRYLTVGPGIRRRGRIDARARRRDRLPGADADVAGDRRCSSPCRCCSRSRSRSWSIASTDQGSFTRHGRARWIASARVRGIVPADGDPRRHIGAGLDGLGRSARDTGRPAWSHRFGGASRP